MASSFSSKSHRNRLRRLPEGASVLLMFLTLFTWLLRCAECVKSSNVILIVTDDLDVELGGMVSVVVISMYSCDDQAHYQNMSDQI